MRLIMLGGHDPLCIENVEHLKELKELAEELNLPFEGDNAVILFKVICIQNSIRASFLLFMFCTNKNMLKTSHVSISFRQMPLQTKNLTTYVNLTFLFILPRASILELYL